MSTAYTLVPTKTLRRWERIMDKLEKEVPAKVELIGKRAAQKRFGLSDSAWAHLIRTGPASIVKRQAGGGPNRSVKIDAGAYQKQYL